MLGAIRLLKYYTRQCNLIWNETIRVAKAGTQSTNAASKACLLFATSYLRLTLSFNTIVIETISSW
jgi:hypothetical protein